MAKIIEFPCPVCGKNLTASSKEEVTRCIHCGKLLYLSNTLDPVGEVHIIVVPANDHIDQSEPIATDQPIPIEPANDYKPRRSRLRPDPDLNFKRFVQYLYAVQSTSYMLWPTKPFPQPTGPTKSVVEQIDEILYENTSNTALEKRYIHLVEDPSAGVIVKVGRESFMGVDAVPDPEIRAAIKAAITQWEKEQ